MNNVNKTLYIPLYGKCYVNRKGIILHDPKAEEIWSAAGFPLKGKSRSKWLAYYMGMRAAVFDRWVRKQLEIVPDALVLHLGCGLDSRAQRVRAENSLWLDVDFPQVIAERKCWFPETETYRMIGADIRDSDFLASIPGGSAIVVMEGISMYLSTEELSRTLLAICQHFDRIQLLMDCYTPFAAQASRYKNPINDVGVTQVYGLDDPIVLEKSGLHFLKEWEMTPQDLIDQLRGGEKMIFQTLFAGGMAKKLYRLYEFGK